MLYSPLGVGQEEARPSASAAVSSSTKRQPGPAGPFVSFRPRRRQDAATEENPLSIMLPLRISLLTYPPSTSTTQEDDGGIAEGETCGDWWGRGDQGGSRICSPGVRDLVEWTPPGGAYQRLMEARRPSWWRRRWRTDGLRKPLTVVVPSSPEPQLCGRGDFFSLNDRIGEEPTKMRIGQGITMAWGGMLGV
jgi:hypothetical protein